MFSRIRNFLCSGSLIFLFASACATSSLEARQEMLARTTGTVIGRVVDAESGVPISGVSVSAQFLGDVTKQDGTYRIIYLDPGKDSVRVWRRDIVEVSIPVTVVAGQTAILDISVEKSPRACCQLKGDWSISLTLDSSDETNQGARTPLSGSIQFDDAIPDPFRGRRIDTNDETVDEFGFYEIDFRPILGDDYYKSTIQVFSENGEDSSFLREASGYVSNRNTVEILLIPRISDFGFGLSGTIDDDTIKGRWHQRAFAGGIRGSFTMTRLAD